MAYIGNWPTNPGFKTVNFVANSITKQTSTQSGKRLRLSIGGTRFSATLQYPSMERATWLPIQAAVTRAQGPLNSFDIQLPTISDNSTGISSLTATVNGTNAAGSTTVNVSTNKNSTTVIEAGDVVRFPSHNKVYMVTSTGTTDGSGNVSLSITPALISAVDDDGSSTVTMDNVPFRMTLAGDTQEFNYATDDTITYELDIVEEE